MNKEMIDAISLIKSSEYRTKVLKAVNGNIITPSEIAEKTGLRLNHVSMVLTELKDNHLVKCLNENTKKGRLYQITDIGKNAISKFG